MSDKRPAATPARRDGTGERAFLGTISIADYEPRAEDVNAALWGNPDGPKDGRLAGQPGGRPGEDHGRNAGR